MWSPTDEQEWSDDAEEDNLPRVERDPETWQDWTSEFTVDAYHMLQDRFASLGVPILDRCSYHDFAQFCYQRSSGCVPDVDAPFPGWHGDTWTPLGTAESSGA
jgi:hypothetical protein